MALDFAAGCVGGAAGVLVGHPFDTVKVGASVPSSSLFIHVRQWHDPGRCVLASQTTLLNLNPGNPKLHSQPTLGMR